MNRTFWKALLRAEHAVGVTLFPNTREETASVTLISAVSRAGLSPTAFPRKVMSPAGEDTRPAHTALHAHSKAIPAPDLWAPRTAVV